MGISSILASRKVIGFNYDTGYDSPETFEYEMDAVGILDMKKKYEEIKSEIQNTGKGKINMMYTGKLGSFITDLLEKQTEFGNLAAFSAACASEWSWRGLEDSDVYKTFKEQERENTSAIDAIEGFIKIYSSLLGPKYQQSI